LYHTNHPLLVIDGGYVPRHVGIPAKFEILWEALSLFNFGDTQVVSEAKVIALSHDGVLQIAKVVEDTLPLIVPLIFALIAERDVSQAYYLIDLMLLHNDGFFDVLHKDQKTAAEYRQHSQKQAELHLPFRCRDLLAFLALLELACGAVDYQPGIQPSDLAIGVDLPKPNFTMKWVG
jgi:hypothetical protein